MTIEEHNRDIDLSLAMDRLIYQTDTCRIFHFSNMQQDQAIRNIMSEFPNQKIWRLAHETVSEEQYETGYLIYHLRSNG